MGHAADVSSVNPTVECSLDGWICCFELTRIQFSSLLDLQDVDFAELPAATLFASPLLNRLVSRVCPDAAQLFEALAHQTITGDIEYNEPIFDSSVLRSAASGAPNPPEVKVIPVCSILDGGRLEWRPGHGLWSVRLKPRFLQKVNGLASGSKKQRWIGVCSLSDICCIPFYVTLYPQLSGFYKKFSATLDSSFDYLDRALYPNVPYVSAPRIAALLTSTKDGPVAQRLAVRYTQTRLVGLVDLLMLGSAGRPDPSYPLLARLAAVLEELSSLPSPLIIIDRPETWFENPNPTVFTELSQMLNTFVSPLARCIVILQLAALPEAFDAAVDIVFGCTMGSLPQLGAAAVKKECASARDGVISLSEDAEAHARRMHNALDAWFDEHDASLFTQTVQKLDTSNCARDASGLKIPMLPEQNNSSESPSPSAVEFYLDYKKSLPTRVMDDLNKFLDQVSVCGTRTTTPRLLLHGPAGSGKSSICVMLRMLSHYNNHRITVVPIVLSELISAAFGVSQRYLDNLMNHAYNARPAVIVFDDIEALVGDKMLDNQWGKEVGNFFCTLLDRPPSAAVRTGGPTVGVLITTRLAHPIHELPKMISTRFASHTVNLPYRQAT